MDETAVTISWFDGAFSDIWSIVKLKKGEEWRENVNKKDILLHDIELTKGQRLKKDTQFFLRTYYDDFVLTE
jgi:hypothetical protein